MEGEAQHDELPTTETTGHVEEHKAGLPQLATETFAGQLFWLVLTFLFLYLVISRVAAPKIGGVVADREARIKGDLDKAADAKRKSEEAVAGYEKALAEARARALKLGDDARKKAQAEADEKNAAEATRLAADTAKAEARISDMRKSAMANVADMARDAAGEIVAKLTGETVAPADLSGAVLNALKRG